MMSADWAYTKGSPFGSAAFTAASTAERCLSPPCRVSALIMSLLQQARSLFVRAGVKSMIDWPLASSWSWNSVVACPDVIPTSVTRAR